MCTRYIHTYLYIDKTIFHLSGSAISLAGVWNAMCRWARMRGSELLWQLGSDFRGNEGAANDETRVYFNF